MYIVGFDDVRVCWGLQPRQERRHFETCLSGGLGCRASRSPLEILRRAHWPAVGGLSNNAKPAKMSACSKMNELHRLNLARDPERPQRPTGEPSDVALTMRRAGLERSHPPVTTRSQCRLQVESEACQGPKERCLGRTRSDPLDLPLFMMPVVPACWVLRIKHLTVLKDFLRLVYEYGLWPPWA